MYNDVILDILFPKVIYKKLLNVNYSLDDLKDLDEKLYENLKFLQCCDDENLEESLGVSFEVEVNNFGNLESVELKPNGGNILVSQSNKEEYIQLYLNWYFNTSIEKFFKSFYTGFYRVAEKNFLKIIDYEELELIICGTKELDFNSLKDGCLVGDGYEEDSETVKYLWEILLNEYNEDMKKKFLFFLTGCDKSPIKGLSSLNMSIGRYGPDSDKIPCAHTCFNFLLLPDYKDKNKLREKLKIAIENSEGFGLM